MGIVAIVFFAVKWNIRLKMQGLSIKSLKKHPSLIPLFVSLGIGVAFSTYYVLRLATRNPDITWNRKSNPEPWQHYADKQYKVLLVQLLPQFSQFTVLISFAVLCSIWIQAQHCPQV